MPLTELIIGTQLYQIESGVDMEAWYMEHLAHQSMPEVGLLMEEVDLVVGMTAIISECDIERSRALVMGKYRSKYVIDESSCFVLVGMRYRYEYIHCVKQATWMLYIARWVW